MKTLWIIAIPLLIISCTEEEAPPVMTPVGPPATEHHTNDKVTDNGNGTSKVVLGNVEFHTNQRDFSGVPVVTDPKTVQGTKVDEYSINKNLKTFRIDGEELVGYVELDAFTSKLMLYHLPSAKILDEHDPDYFIAGFDYQGVIMDVEGGESINFYKLENGIIQQHFFHITSLNGSKFLSNGYLDHDRAYVYDVDKLLEFKFNNTKQVNNLVDLPSFAALGVAIDNEYLYLSVGDGTDSKIQWYNKSMGIVEHEVMVPRISLESISVDANYVYAVSPDAGEVIVLNKHTYTDAGKLSIPNVETIDVVGNLLYALDSKEMSIIKYEIAFQ